MLRIDTAYVGKDNASDKESDPKIRHYQEIGETNVTLNSFFSNKTFIHVIVRIS